MITNITALWLTVAISCVLRILQLFFKETAFARGDQVELLLQ